MLEEPTPPVTYMRRVDVLSNRCLHAAIRVSSPVSRATSAMPVARYIARTEWPSGAACSRTGRWLCQ